MKNLIQSVVVAFLVVTAGMATVHAGDFEDTIESSVTWKRGTAQKMTTYIKGAAMRIETAGPGSVMIISPKYPGKMLTLAVATKAYSVAPVPTDPNAKVQIKKLGNETILGHPCTHIEAIVTTSTGTNRSEYWFSQDLGNRALLKEMLKSTPSGEAMMRAMEQAGWTNGIYLKMIAYQKSGEVLMKQEPVQIAAQSVSSALFDIPSGYHEMKTPAGK
ncbi:MAG: DUF4412 domain-containing protein [Candidatus Deferrimicrobium sp.]